jgi:hypothetical protein
VGTDEALPMLYLLRSKTRGEGRQLKCFS